MKWNKRKFIDGIQIFYKGIANLAMIDKME